MSVTGETVYPRRAAATAMSSCWSVDLKPCYEAKLIYLLVAEHLPPPRGACLGTVSAVNSSFPIRSAAGRPVLETSLGHLEVVQN